MHRPIIIATTTTAKILLFVLNASVMLLGTALTIVASGLNASIVAASLTASLGSVTSVSYTHLDVYKRQQLYCARSASAPPMRNPIIIGSPRKANRFGIDFKLKLTFRTPGI